MDWITLAVALAVLVTGIFGISVLFAAYRLLRSNACEYRVNRVRSGTVADVLKGNISRRHDGQRDSVTQAGLAIDKDNRWIEQARLSEDSVYNVLR